MKWEIVLWSIMLGIGVVASFWNFGHLYFTALPSGVLLWVSILEYRKEQKRKEQNHETFS